MALLPSGIIPFTLYVVCSSISVINSDPETVERSYYAIVLLVKQLSFFFCLANYFRLPKRLGYILKSFFFVVLYTVFVAINQRYRLGLHRLGADFAHPNQMVFYLLSLH